MRRLTLVTATALLVACGVYRVTPDLREPADIPLAITVPAKAHLKDGGVVLFASGLRVEHDAIVGLGEKYDVARATRTLVDRVPLADVAALEQYESDLQVGRTIAINAGYYVLAATGLCLAFCGSCPTVYPAGAPDRLEAELFSHSISRRFETDDVDRLAEARWHDGGFRLDLANEAVETHYINRLALEVVDHPAGTRAYAAPDGNIVVVEDEAAVQAHGPSGVDATAALARSDGLAHRTEPAALRHLARELTEDWLELTARAPPDGRRPVLVLRARNTLMTTVLFYNVMLQGQGIRALEWTGTDTDNPLYAWRIKRWFEEHYGLRVQYWNGRRFVEVANVVPTGPIAWHDAAVELPVTPGPEIRVRVASLPDNWMVDSARIGVAGEAHATRAVVAAAAVEGLSGAAAGKVLDPLRSKDGEYLVTEPGERHTLFFPVAPPASGTQRTAFLRSRGFYIEWLRDAWFTATQPPTPFEPDDAAVIRTAQLWLERKEEMERRFSPLKMPLARAAP